MFFDTTGNITSAFRFGASMQKLLVDDPVNGDLTMQNHVVNFMGSSLQMSGLFGLGNVDTLPPETLDFAFMHGSQAQTHKYVLRSQ
jgi:hypothetical protein